MGCSTSKLEDEEAVRLCKDRRKFIKQAVDHRLRFATGHIAYIQSLQGVSSALCDYIEGDKPREFLLDSYSTPPPIKPVKKPNPGFISMSPNSYPVISTKSGNSSSYKINYLRSGGNPAVVVEEIPPQPPETVTIETYQATHNYGLDGFFEMQSSPVNSSFFSHTPNNRPNLPPSSPQTSPWDFFWNPFTSLDYYGYPNGSSIDQNIIDDDDINRMRQLREEEGIPDLEEDEAEYEETNGKVNNVAEERSKIDLNYSREDSQFKKNYANGEAIVEEEDEDDEEYETDSGMETEEEVNGLQSHRSENVEVFQAQTAGKVEISNEGKVVSDEQANEKTPDFTVYVNRMPKSMVEVIKYLESQFKIVCHSAREVSTMLEASRAPYSSMLNEHTAMKVLNPVALIRSASSRSASSRFVLPPSSSRDESYDGCNDLSKECCMLAGSHQSTLEKLYAWEKKLYDEVKSGERFRIAYEKKHKHLRNQDVRGLDPTVVDKTRVAIRNLQTQMTVSLHRIEAISKKIETLRDEELQPQLLELIQGLAKMWRVMAGCHQSQKRTLDEAKYLLAGTPSKFTKAKKHAVMSTIGPHRLALLASNLERQIRNWRVCFESWINSQRSYVQSLTGWLLRCIRLDSEASGLSVSPRHTSGAPQIFGMCIQWSRFLDGVHETRVVDGLDFFAAGMGSLYAQQLREDSRRGSKRFELDVNTQVVEFGQTEEEAMSAEKMAEVAIKVLCAGMSMAMTSLTEFSIAYAEGYDDLSKQWEKSKQPQISGEAA